MNAKTCICVLICRVPGDLVIDLDLEELTLTELLEVETALVTFMMSILLLRCPLLIFDFSMILSEFIKFLFLK